VLRLDSSRPWRPPNGDGKVGLEGPALGLEGLARRHPYRPVRRSRQRRGAVVDAFRAVAASRLVGCVEEGVEVVLPELVCDQRWDVHETEVSPVGAGGLLGYGQGE
jgi:hypothetical protein